MSEITYHEFAQIDMRVGTIIEVMPFPEARKPAYQLKIDFGAEIGVKKTSAQITDHYELNDLVGRQVVAVVNFTPKQIGPFMSEVLVLGFSDENGKIILIQPDNSVPNGQKLH